MTRLATPAGWTGPLRMIERNALTWKRSWWVIATGVIEPVLYLFGLGLGMGSLVGTIEWAGEVVDYPDFIAPGLMASAAATGALFDSTYNFHFKLKFTREFEGILHTPISLNQIVAGEASWAILRGAMGAGFFLATMLALGLVQSWWAVLTIPAALLIAGAFAAAGMAITTLVRTWDDFDLLDLVTQPLFLASTTFFPASVYPAGLRPLLNLTPLYHGVAIMRDLTLGTVGWTDLGHVAYLVAMIALAGTITHRRLRTALLS